MSNRLYVGNLPYRTTEAELEELLSQQDGFVSIVILTDRDTGRSRGFGFAEYETEEAAQAAIEAFNGKEFDGRTLRVDVAQERRQRNNRY